MRGIIPEVLQPLHFSQAVNKKNETLWLVAASPSEIIDTAQPVLTLFRSLQELPASLGIWIGPEGGFSPLEMKALTAAGAYPVTLGPRVLRTETAGMALLAQINCVWSELYDLS
jgi:16S rRNA (uracil1498-N3)-methyltransferase